LLEFVFVVSVVTGGGWCHCRVLSITMVVSASLSLIVGCCIGSQSKLQVLVAQSDFSGWTEANKSKASLSVVGIIVVVWYIIVVIVVLSLLANKGCGSVAAVLYHVIIVIFASSALTIAGWCH